MNSLSKLVFILGIMGIVSVAPAYASVIYGTLNAGSAGNGTSGTLTGTSTTGGSGSVTGTVSGGNSGSLTGTVSSPTTSSSGSSSSGGGGGGAVIFPPSTGGTTTTVTPGVPSTGVTSPTTSSVTPRVPNTGAGANAVGNSLTLLLAAILGFFGYRLYRAEDFKKI